MKAIFKSTKDIEFKPIDSNEEILLKNFQEASENQMEIVDEKDVLHLVISEPKEILPDSDLRNKTLYINIPASYCTEELETHDLITFTNGGKISVSVNPSKEISIMLDMKNEHPILLYHRLADKTVEVNIKMLKLDADKELVVKEVKKDSVFYEFFTI